MAHNLTVGTKYQFRVQAFNEMGASEHSSPSSILQMDNLIREGTPNSVNMVLSVSISALIAFCSLMTLLLFYGMASFIFSLALQILSKEGNEL